jgi:hypothetical protein
MRSFFLLAPPQGDIPEDGELHGLPSQGDDAGGHLTDGEGPIGLAEGEFQAGYFQSPKGFAASPGHGFGRC